MLIYLSNDLFISVWTHEYWCALWVIILVSSFISCFTYSKFDHWELLSFGSCILLAHGIIFWALLTFWHHKTFQALLFSFFFFFFLFCLNPAINYFPKNLLGCLPKAAKCTLRSKQRQDGALQTALSTEKRVLSWSRWFWLTNHYSSQTRVSHALKVAGLTPFCNSLLWSPHLANSALGSESLRV